MKILVLSHTSDLLGGAERSMLDVFDNWATKHNISPEFIVREPTGTLGPELKKRGWKYHALNYTFWSMYRLPKKPEDKFHFALINTKAIKSIERIILQTKPDVVVTNSIVCPWAALAAYFQRVPHIWFVREYGDLDHGRLFELPSEKIFEDVGNLSNLVVTISESLAKYVKQHVAESKVSLLYNPFNLERITNQSLVKVPSPYQFANSLKLVMTGNLAATKGQLEAIEACGILNKSGIPTEICLLGQQTDKEYGKLIKKVIKDYGIADKVHLMGLQKNALAYVAHADVGIIASRLEAFGRATFEYLAVGKPVVGANSGATPEMVVHGVNGYLYIPQDPQDLSKQLRHYSGDKKQIERHGQAGLAKAKAMMAGNNNIDELYKKVVAVASGKGSPKGGPINYLHKWLEYVEAGEISIFRYFKVFAYQKMRAVYFRLRNLRERLRGR